MNLVKIKKSDFPLLEQWFDSERIYRWFGESEFWLSEFEYEPDSSFMLEYEEEKIGFCRYTTQIPTEYLSVFPHVFPPISMQAVENQEQIQSFNNIQLEDTKQSQIAKENIQFDFAYISRLPIYFVDYGIGSLNHEGRGLGKKMLQLLCDKIADKNECVLAATSSLKNIASCHILKSNGFCYDKQSNLFLKIINKHTLGC